MWSFIVSICIIATAERLECLSDHLFSLQGQGQTFEFPNLFPEKEQDTETRSFDDFKNKYMEREKQRQKGDPRRGGVPDWFGL